MPKLLMFVDVPDGFDLGDAVAKPGKHIAGLFKKGLKGIQGQALLEKANPGEMVAEGVKQFVKQQPAAAVGIGVGGAVVLVLAGVGVAKVKGAVGHKIKADRAAKQKQKLAEVAEMDVTVVSDPNTELATVEGWIELTQEQYDQLRALRDAGARAAEILERSAIVEAPSELEAAPVGAAELPAAEPAAEEPAVKSEPLEAEVIRVEDRPAS